MSANGERLPRAFFARPTLEVAPDLLGLWLVHDLPGGRRSGRIVEVEAYGGLDDLASHASKGQTARTSVMYGPPGHAYVYLIYGLHHCMNVVTEAEGRASAVLLRAIEPVHGVEGRTQGPGLLCKAMGIDRRLDGHDLTSAEFHIERPQRVSSLRIVKRPRIGVDYAGHWARRLLRFYIHGNPFVSKP